MYILAITIIFLPLLSSIINGILYRKINYNLLKIIAISSTLISHISSIIIFIYSGLKKQKIYIILSTWININNISIKWEIYVDQLTSIMFLLITTVSFVVHVYSLWYMNKDKYLAKFLSFLSLFTFFMLMLVAANNFLQLFFGWEGVGVCSYLLIGYYYKKKSANNAAIKAFIVNRIADSAIIIGLVTIVFYTNSLNFNDIFIKAESLSKTTFNLLQINIPVLDYISFLLFIGCMGKSAQIGMHVWLPDAMEGPTPVSALIHSATMVTAGVFLLVRCSFIYEYSPTTLKFITIIGTSTCIFAAIIAVTQNDIKKIIAYSTCSQLGYMILACGVSSYQAAIFHLVTHGFFKSLLFLSAGSIIHVTHEQNIYLLGGLKNKMPITYVNFLIGSLAIMGIFPFAGFYSKDLIIESAYAATGNEGKFAFIIGIISACLTSIYSLKIIILVFYKKTNLNDNIFNKIDEPPFFINMVLFILVAGSLFSGMLGYYILEIHNSFGFLSGSVFNLDLYKKLPNHSQHTITHTILKILPLLTAILGVIIAVFLYYRNLAVILKRKIFKIHYLAQNKFFIDQIYNICLVKTINLLSKFIATIDKKVLDKFGPQGVAVIVKELGTFIRTIHTGYISDYFLYIMIILITSITVFIITDFPIL